MKRNKGHGKSAKMPNSGNVRASISFPPALYDTLEGIAKNMKVSLAWVVRDAVEKYIAGHSERDKNTKSVNRLRP